MPRRRNQELRILRRDFLPSLAIPDCQYRVRRYSRHVLGGPRRSTITATGDRGSLLQLLTLLRSPVEIYDEEAGFVWHGYIHTVTITLGNLGIGRTLDNMGNRLAVTYTRPTPGANGSRKQRTPWAEDPISIATYGRKERIVTLADSDDAGAVFRRDVVLSRVGEPIAITELGSGDPTEAVAEIVCHGWYDTLSWLYFERLDGRTEYTTSGGKAEPLPFAGGRIGQSFQIVGSVAWPVSTMSLRMKRKDAPGADPSVDPPIPPIDTTTIALHADNGAGLPGAILGSASIASSSIDTQGQWLSRDLATPITLQPSITYWIVVSRSQVVDDGTQVTVDLDEGIGYPTGVLRVFDGTNWIQRSPDADLIFQSLGVEETTVQLQQIGDVAGQFFAAVDIIAASGRETVPYRDGSRTALNEFSDLLEFGDANGVRLLPNVLPDRSLRVAPELPKPTRNQASHYLTVRNEIDTPTGVRLVPAACITGLWVRPRELIGTFSDVEPIFIEETTYDCDADRCAYVTRDQPDPFDITDIRS